MSEIQLTGLKSGSPIGFMAALGALRHAAEMLELGSAQLRWAPYGGEWCAVIITGNEVTAGEFIQLFVERVKGMKERPEFSWAEQIKKHTPFDFRKHALENAGSHDWFAAFGSELNLAKDRTIKSTMFDMTGGQQKLLSKLMDGSRVLAEDSAGAVDLFREAFFGPWRYRFSKGSDADNSHSLGLDPTTVLKGALAGSEPAKTKDKRGIRAAIWLSFEALPLFPCVHDKGLATVGFRRLGKKTFLEWTTWESALSLATIKTLLMHPEESNLAARGSLAKFRSERINLEQDYYTFAPAEMV